MRVPFLGLCRIGHQAVRAQPCKLVRVVGFGEFEGTSSKPSLRGAKEILSGNDDVALAQVLVTHADQPFGLGGGGCGLLTRGNGLLRRNLGLPYFFGSCFF